MLSDGGAYGYQYGYQRVRCQLLAKPGKRVLRPSAPDPAIPIEVVYRCIGKESGEDKIFTMATGDHELTEDLEQERGIGPVELKGHAGAVVAVAWSPDGIHIATSSHDGTAHIWDRSTGRTIHTLTGHTNTVNAVAWSPDGTQLATASRDDTACIWDPNSGQQIGRPLTGHTRTVLEVAWCPDGTQLATASRDETARLCDKCEIDPPDHALRTPPSPPSPCKPTPATPAGKSQIGQGLRKR